MKKIFLLPLVLGGVLLTSCQDEDFGYESSKIAYEKTMTQMLGEVAADQTWVNAEQGYVTISEECKSVKVFDGLTGKMIARYSNLKAGDKVYYNATIGYNPTITNGAMAMEVTNGQTVSFASEGPSQVTVEYGNTDKSITSFGKIDKSKYINFKKDFISKDFHRYGIDNENIRKKVEFVATNANENGTSTFLMYPAYWDCEEHLTVGIYYYDPATGEMVVDENPIYENREKNTVLFGNAAGATQAANSWACVGDVTCSELRTQTGSGRFTQWDVFPIYVTVPKNMVFGFWIKGDNDKVYYGNPSLNEDCDKEDCSHSGVFDPNVLETYYRPFYTTTEESAGVAKPVYLGMSANNHKESGYYDIYFVLKAVKDINYEMSTYTMAFEDLGATGIEDMDFNDCVLRLTCVSGLPVATISLLAAGGRLPIQVTYDDNTVWEEVHAAFDQELVPVNANKYYTGVSTDVVSVTAVPTKTIELPSDDWDIKDLVAMFELKVTRADGTYNQVSIPTNPGLYPMGFAVAGEFKWPGEQQNIIGTYPDFATWAANSGYAYWYPWSAE